MGKMLIKYFSPPPFLLLVSGYKGVTHISTTKRELIELKDFIIIQKSEWGAIS